MPDKKIKEEMAPLFVIGRPTVFQIYSFQTSYNFSADFLWKYLTDFQYQSTNQKRWYLATLNDLLIRLHPRMARILTDLHSVKNPATYYIVNKLLNMKRKLITFPNNDKDEMPFRENNLSSLPFSDHASEIIVINGN